jgi:hypothetical protein
MESKENSKQSPYVRTSPQQATNAQPVMHPVNPPKHGVSGATVFFVLVLMLALGVGAGYGASFVSAKTGTSLVPAALNPNAPVKGKIYGNGDTSTFKDTAEGILQKGGDQGDGEYHLVRSGGPSQNVYLTSSSLDLSQFVGSKVKVWGQTQAAQHAGWLMDVGKVEVE